MPRRGRPAAPTQLKMIKGERPSRINRHAPLPVDEPPTPPPWLTDETDLAEFERVAGELWRSGIAKQADADAIGHLVAAEHVFRDAYALVRQAGVLVRDRDGDARRSPALLAARQWSHEARAWAVELGFTPSARESLHVSMPALGSHAERLLT